MNLLLIIVGIVGIIIGLWLWKFTEGSLDVQKIGKMVLIVSVLLGVFGCCFKIVPTGYTGVRTTFGQVSERTVQKGFNFKIPFVQNIKLVNNKQQDKKFKEEVWGETLEKTPIYASDTIVTYQINSEKSSWLYTNIDDPDSVIEQNLVASSIKSAMIELGVNEVTNRSKIEPLTKEKLNASLKEKYGENTVNVLKIVINNMDFEESYNEAIAAKSIAQQTYEKQQIENNTAIAKAEADKKVSVTNAEAKAEATLIAAEAEAAANELLIESLTDEVLRSKFYETWNGVLPSVMSDGTVITDIGTTSVE